MAKAAKRPSRDEFEMEELGNQLVEAQREDSEVVLTVWGWAEPVQGVITQMDTRTRLIYVTSKGEITKVPFMDIMKVRYPE